MTRPLVSLDIETTGAQIETARVIEIGMVRLAGGERVVTRILVNPCGPIPPESTAVHGITDADVANAPTFAQVAPSLVDALAGCDLTGYNLRTFDLPVLRREFDAAGVAWPCDDARVIDSFVIFRERERHTLANAVRVYCGREHVNAHSAASDAEAALDVLLGQIARYNLPDDRETLDAEGGGRRAEWATAGGQLRWNDAGDLYLAFGKFNGQRLVDADRGFLRWVLTKTFPDDVKAFVAAVLKGQRPMREVQS